MYASRSLNKAERNYPAHKLEFLALKWAVTEKFHDFLYGNSFTVLNVTSVGSSPTSGNSEDLSQYDPGC